MFLTRRTRLVFAFVAVAACLVVGSSDHATADRATTKLAPELKIADAFNGLTKGAQLKKWRGKPVVLKFWSPRCGPCRRQLPRLQKLYDRWASKGVHVVAISLADKSRSKAFIEKMGYSFPVAIDDASQTTSNRYAVNALPTTFLVDCKGRLCHVGRSLEDAIARELKQADAEDQK